QLSERLTCRRVVERDLAVRWRREDCTIARKGKPGDLQSLVLLHDVARLHRDDLSGQIPASLFLSAAAVKETEFAGAIGDGHKPGVRCEGRIPNLALLSLGKDTELLAGVCVPAAQRPVGAGLGWRRKARIAAGAQHRLAVGTEYRDQRPVA